MPLRAPFSLVFPKAGSDSSGLHPVSHLIWLDSRQPAAWQRAENLVGTLQTEGKQGLLRDCAELNLAFEFLKEGAQQASERHLLSGVLHHLRLLYRRFQVYFEIEQIWFVDLMPVEMQTLFSSRAATNPLSAKPVCAGGRLALVFTNEEIPHVTKTSEVLAQACRKMGYRVQVRDPFPLRLVSSLLREESKSGIGPGTVARLAAETSRLYDRILDGEKECLLLALDFHWYFSADLFLDDSRIKKIVSFWYDDVKAWCQGAPNTCLAGAEGKIQTALRHPKVWHYCYGQGQLDEMHLLGLNQVKKSFLAAPLAYVRSMERPSILSRAAFIGNPGLRLPPPPQLIALMEKGAELAEIRQEARKQAMAVALNHFSRQISQEPSVRDWLAYALILRAGEPYTSALSLLLQAARNYPRAAEIINENGLILDAALVVKMANQFDRAALVHRLYRAGLVDVFSNPEEWKPYGIEARPDVVFSQLPAVYQRYTCHLNGYNAMRDATANEKLFEIAACGRVSVNLSSPDVLAAYRPGEVACVETLSEAEEQVGFFLGQPEEALAWGERARQRTRREHLWEHRIAAMLRE